MIYPRGKMASTISGWVLPTTLMSQLFIHNVTADDLHSFQFLFERKTEG
jgi:hypothetical protein